MLFIFTKFKRTSRADYCATSTQCSDDDLKKQSDFFLKVPFFLCGEKEKLGIFDDHSHIGQLANSFFMK